MVDARVPDRWLTDRRWLRLTPRERHDGISLLLWAVAVRSDGILDRRDLHLCPWPIEVGSVAALLAGGLLLEIDDDHVGFADWSGSQTTRAELDAAAEMRRKGRERQRRHRAKKAGEEVTTNLVVTRDGHVTQQAEAEAEAEAEVNARASREKSAGLTVQSASGLRCSRHPNGDTGEACGECGEVRRKTVASGADRAQARTTAVMNTVVPGARCAPGTHRLVRDGTCMRCDLRPGEADPSPSAEPERQAS